MSDSQAYEEITVTSDGVTVVKRFEEDEFPVPAIAFEFTSERDEEVSVRLSDTVPDGIEVEDLGFHPEYGSEFWMIDDDTITFERDLDAGASYTTVYGIRATGSDDVEQFLTEPTLEEVDPPLPEEEKDEEDIIPESGDDVVKDAISGEGEIPGLEDEGDEEEGGEGDDVTLDLKDPNEPESEQTAAQTADGESETGDSDGDGGGETSTAEVSVEGSSVVAAMAAEIRQQNVSADDVKLLRRAFEIAGEDGGTTAAKLQQIQTDIADLRAYTSAMEEFLEDNGTAEQMLGEFESQLDEFESQLDSLQSEFQSTTSELDEMSSEVDSLGEEVSSVSEEVQTFADDIDSIDEEVTSVSSEVDSVSEEVDTLGEEVDSMSEEVDSVSGDVDSMDDEIDQLSSAIDSVEGEIDELQDQVTNGDVAERLDDIESEINDLQEWQDQIKSTFGG